LGAAAGLAAAFGAAFGVAFTAVRFLAAGRLVAAFFAAGRLAVDFLAVDRLAVDFLAPERFAVDFLAVDRFGVDFLAFDFFFAGISPPWDAQMMARALGQADEDPPLLPALYSIGSPQRQAFPSSNRCLSVRSASSAR
jgi:hypothetical protein